ncbi:hypothetical protein [Pelagicoccus sp. SDUM812005]|uniref:hypothetical protein n=1 Tax=Pelagicoccus sp. SDUM812005 TaxID=3041257 RepID=UPI00280D2DA9|nr:hypothetical protein [Pelagicoccus sp. SDUM812005]MDQ8183726.1 hypothetical protein [Pelagicoccus sp. SDUM812005]
MADHSYGAATDLGVGDVFSVEADLYGSDELFTHRDFWVPFGSGEESPEGSPRALESFKVFVDGEEVGFESSVGGHIYTSNYRVKSQVLTGPSNYELDFDFDWRSGLGSLVLWGRYLDDSSFGDPMLVLRGDISSYGLRRFGDDGVPVPDIIGSSLLLLGSSFAALGLGLSFRERS